MDKKGQLGMIEFKYLLVGLVLGVILGLVVVILGCQDILPFQIPLTCG